MGNRNLKFRVLATPLRGGSDPDIIERDDIDSCAEVYCDWPEIETPCDLSPSGQCVYSWRDNFHACIHCKQPSGLDE